MNFFRKWLRLIARIFQKKEPNVIIEQSQEVKEQINTVTESNIDKNDVIVNLQDATDKIESSQTPIEKEIFQSWKIDFNEYKLFFPNWGELDPTVSTISNGRIQKEFINFLYDEFANRYGSLTTDLGYGLIYSIVMNAIETKPLSTASR